MTTPIIDRERLHLCHEPEAERAIIGSLLLATANGDTDCPTTVFGALAPRDFADPQLRTLFAAAERLHQRGEAMEHILWLRETDGELPHDDAATLLLQCGQAVVTTATVGSYVRLVAEASRQRRAVCLVNDALNELRTSKNAVDVVQRLQLALTTTHGDGHQREPDAVPLGEPFPTHALPTAVREYVCAAAAAIGCDASFVALPLLACLARAIGNKRVVKLKRTWCEPPIIWAAIVGKSGTHKTPAMMAAMRFLDRRQQESLVQYREALATYDQDKAIYDRDYVAWKRFRKSTEPPPWPPAEPVCVRYVTTDTTIEALAALLAAQFDGLLVSRDELAGWLGGIAEYKGGKGSDLGHWLACWSAAPLIVDRKTGTTKMIHVPHAAVSIVGGIQPGVLREAIGREHLQDGLCARLLVAMPEPRQVKWSEAIVDSVIEAAMQNVFDRLLSLEPAADEDGQPTPFPVPLTPEAKAAWVSYYDRHRAELVELDDNLAAAWSKLEAYTARFALVFQLCFWAAGEADCEAVDQASMESAITLSDWFGGEARRVYGLFAEREEDRDQRELVELIRRKGGVVTPRALMRSSRRWVKSGEAEAALDRLAKGGWGTWEVIATATNQRRQFRLLTPLTLTDSPESPEVGECVSVNAVNGAPAHGSQAGREALEQFECERQQCADEGDRIPF